MVVEHLVFTQSPGGRLDVTRARKLAQSFFGATLELMEQSFVSVKNERRRVLRVAIRSTQGAFDEQFEVQTRARTQDDQREAMDAEARGGRFGMGALVEPCKHVWVVRPLHAPNEAATWTLCAVLASLGLGPVLPPDRSTLLGVRAAYARGDREFSSYR